VPEEAERVARAIDDLVRAAEQALGDDLRSVVHFGSAAEDRLRATSDVNVILVPSLEVLLAELGRARDAPAAGRAERAARAA
jgi:predicted nucleotidyltransferase